DGGELDPTYEGYPVGGTQAPPRPRRSLYLRQIRDNFPVMHKLFDGTSANASCPRRHVSTVASQPLYLLNNPFVLKQAEAFATRVLQNAGNNSSRQIEVAFLLALGRPPDQADREAVHAFFESHKGPVTRPQGGAEQKTTLDKPPLRLIHLCHAILNLNEFVYM